MVPEKTGSMLRGRITGEAVELMRRRIGYSNPTVRSGVRQPPHWTVASHDAMRHWTQGYGDDNPLYVDARYGASTRWGGQIGPPGFEQTVAESRPGPKLPPDEERETSRALRGVQLYASGTDIRWYRPVRIGDWGMATGHVHDVQDKVSAFAGRSVIVTNLNRTWNQNRELISEGQNWFVHAERRKVVESESLKGPRVEPASYASEDIAEIEAAYDAEYRRGADTLYFEDLEVGQRLPRMVKGPVTVTDMINMHMGGGWFGYGNPALRLGYENRKLMRGFYTKNRFGAWDVIQRVHWEEETAREVGVPRGYHVDRRHGARRLPARARTGRRPRPDCNQPARRKQHHRTGDHPRGLARARTDAPSDAAGDRLARPGTAVEPRRRGSARQLTPVRFYLNNLGNAHIRLTSAGAWNVAPR
jgi:acyl dehydratase